MRRKQVVILFTSLDPVSSLLINGSGRATFNKANYLVLHNFFLIYVYLLYVDPSWIFDVSIFLYFDTP